MAVNVICLGSFLGILLLKDSAVPAIVLNLAALSMGCLGGAIYFFLAAEFYMDPHVGLIMALSASVPYILQFILTPVLRSTLVNVVLLFALTGIIMYFVKAHPKDYILENALPYAEETEDYRRDLFMDKVRTLGVFFLVMILGVYMEQSWSAGVSADEVNMYGWQRLCAIPGYFFIAAFADHKKHKYIDIALVCAYAFYGIGAYTSGSASVNLAVFYFLAGVYTGYLNLAFWFLAPKTRHPDIWACLGRVLSLFEGLIGIGLFYLKKGSFTEHLILGVILCGLFMLLYLLKEKGVEEAVIEESAPDEENLFEIFCGESNLTPREKDVMRLLLQSDENMKTLSEELGISERMLYRYMNSLYTKIGADNRAGLVKKYYEKAGK